jgi:CO dehydrogenase nickel-insertion accessory protein CooC1
VSGQGGVGKTFLLNRLQRLAQAEGAVSAVSDERQQDIPSLLGALAKQFEESGIDLKNFSQRYRVYLEKRKELEGDPEAPQGLPALIGRAVGKAAYIWLGGFR